jgi:hypothetical protein
MCACLTTLSTTGVLGVLTPGHFRTPYAAYTRWPSPARPPPTDPARPGGAQRVSERSALIAVATEAGATHAGARHAVATPRRCNRRRCASRRYVRSRFGSSRRTAPRSRPTRPRSLRCRFDPCCGPTRSAALRARACTSEPALSALVVVRCLTVQRGAEATGKRGAAASKWLVHIRLPAPCHCHCHGRTQ